MIIVIAISFALVSVVGTRWGAGDVSAKPLTRDRAVEDQVSGGIQYKYQRCRQFDLTQVMAVTTLAVT